MPLGQIPTEQQPVTKRVYPPGNACRERMNQIEASRLKLGIAGPADMVKAMLDVGLRLRPVHRAKGIRGHDALPELLHLRALHHGAKFWLTDQKALQQGMIAKLEIGKHAQFLDRSRCKILCLVDNEKGSFAFHGDLAQQRLERSQQDCLAHGPHWQAESYSDCTKHVVGVELRADELRGHDLFPIELLQEATHQRRFSGADFSGDDNESFAFVETVLQICERALVAATTEIERGIGVELERLSGELVEGLVHGGSAERVVHTYRNRVFGIGRGYSGRGCIGAKALISRTSIDGRVGG